MRNQSKSFSGMVLMFGCAFCGRRIPPSPRALDFLS
ncbi:hypothetical protein LINGRAHAP2_LOCUS24075 [Linum grandiflorum]